MRKLYIAVAVALAILVPTNAFSAAAFVSGPDVKLLKPSINLKDLARLIAGALDPSSSAVNAPKGSIYLSTSTGRIYVKQDAGSSTNWLDGLTSSTGWQRAGNAGTVAGTDFLGTTDAVDLVIKTNGTERFRLLSAGGARIAGLSTGLIHSDGSGNLTSSLLVNADVAVGAAIARSKIASGTSDHVLINDGAGAMSSEAQLAISRGGTGVSTAGAAPWVEVAGDTMTGQLVMPLGSSGAPSIAATGALGNGWWFPSTVAQAWSIAGAELMRLIAGPKLGINTTTPDSPLHIKAIGTAAADGMTLETSAGVKYQVTADATGFYIQRGTNYPLITAASGVFTGSGDNYPRFAHEVRRSDTGTDPTALAPNSGTNNFNALVLSNGTSTANNFSALGFAGNSATAANVVDTMIAGVHETHTATPTGHMRFYVSNGAGKFESMRLNALGQSIFGVGATTPDVDTTTHIKCANDNVGNCLVIEATGSGAGRYLNFLQRADSTFALYNPGNAEQIIASNNSNQHTYFGPSAGSSLYRVGIGSIDTTTTITDYTTVSSIRPGLSIRNTSATNNNFATVAFHNQQTAFVAGISGVNENHNAVGTQTGHLAFLAAKAGAVVNALSIYADQYIFSLFGRGVLVSSATGVVTSKALTNGQILIGSTGADPVGTTITAGAGVAVANGAGTITISTSGSPAPISSVKTGNYTLLATDDDVVYEGSADGTFTIPDCTATGSKKWWLYNNSNYVLTIALTGGGDSFQPSGDVTYQMLAKGDVNSFLCAGGTKIYVH